MDIAELIKPSVWNFLLVTLMAVLGINLLAWASTKYSIFGLGGLVPAIV